MSAVSFIVGGVLPYLAVIAFIGGMAYRFYVWLKTPQPGKMTLFPAGGSTAKEVLKETLFFPSLYRGDKVLWAFAWLFHVTLALVFLGHIRVFTGLIDRILGIGMTPGQIDTMSAVSGGAAGIVLLATGVLLLVRRLAIQRVREVSGTPDFFGLLLLLAIIATGDVMRFGAHFDLTITRTWAWSVLIFSPQVGPLAQYPMFLAHAFLAQLLIIYIPFSKVLHFGGIFFTQALVKRR